MKSVAIVTTTRAEWSLLRPFADALVEDGVEVRLLVSGTHLSKEHGYTYDEIIASGFKADRLIDILCPDAEDVAVSASRAVALAIEGAASYFQERRPDAVLLLGDRYEVLGFCIAAFLARIPIMHVHGGERTDGAIDDAVRHSITKMSDLHLTAAEDYRRRVIQLGEDPASVFNVGAVGVENAVNVPKMSRGELGRSLAIDSLGEFALLTFHPETRSALSPEEQIRIVLQGMRRCPLPVIATKANADVGGSSINAVLEEYMRENEDFCLFDSLGSLRYLNALRLASVVIGNSSSGLLEAPAFGTPTVNIGSRQDGRIRAASVIDCELDPIDIQKAIEKAFRAPIEGELSCLKNPFGDGNVSRKAARIINDFLDGKISGNKGFYDIAFECQSDDDSDG